jgi:hypothetical protein
LISYDNKQLLDPRYPIGTYEQQPFSIERKVEWLADLNFFLILFGECDFEPG